MTFPDSRTIDTNVRVEIITSTITFDVSFDASFDVKSLCKANGQYTAHQSFIGDTTGIDWSINPITSALQYTSKNIISTKFYFNS